MSWQNSMQRDRCVGVNLQLQGVRFQCRSETEGALNHPLRGQTMSGIV